MQIGDAVRARLYNGSFVKGEIQDISPRGITVRGRIFQEHEVRLESDIEAKKEAIWQAELKEKQVRRQEFKESFRGLGGFFVKLISNQDRLEDEITWYNDNNPVHKIENTSEGVYGYPATSKGGVQYQGTCGSREAAEFLRTWGFDIIERPDNFEVNDSERWKELISIGAANVGANN